MIFKVRPTSDAAYTGVEAVLNHQNYWVDMQRTGRVRDMSWDLDNFEHWEFVFLQSSVAVAGEVAEGNELASPPGSPVAEGRGIKSADTKAGGEEAATVQGGEEVLESDQVLDLPPSWVQRLHIDRDVYLQRYSKEGQDVKRSQAYRRSRAELFAENSRSAAISIYLCTYLSSIYLSIYLSIHLSIYPSIYLSIYTYVHTYIHQYGMRAELLAEISRSATASFHPKTRGCISTRTCVHPHVHTYAYAGCRKPADAYRHIHMYLHFFFCIYRADGMVQRLTKYRDYARTQVLSMCMCVCVRLSACV